ncbi:hypothetical protein L9F63_009678, partial [Diploptera punctata]
CSNDNIFFLKYVHLEIEKLPCVVTDHNSETSYYRSQHEYYCNIFVVVTLVTNLKL